MMQILKTSTQKKRALKLTITTPQEG